MLILIRPGKDRLLLSIRGMNGSKRKGRTLRRSGGVKKQVKQGWPIRFQRLMDQVGQNLEPKEVCAESWPGQSLLEAAEECVASWQQSLGRWKAVSSRQAAYAYDMKQGSIGVWCATGILAIP